MSDTKSISKCYALPNMPDNYLPTARNCSLLNTVGSQMAKDWNVHKPKEGDFDWTPSDNCPSSMNLFSKFDLSNVTLIWSNFTYGLEKKTVNEPFAFIVSDGTSDYLIFRGTLFETDHNTPDLIADLDANLIPYKDAGGTVQGKVSEGFSRVFDGLQNGLKEQLALISGNNRPLIITGHSLGSTLATLAFALISDPTSAYNFPQLSNYPQASPKVGNTDFASWYSNFKGETFRLVDTFDKVPKQPPFDAYVHVGNEITYDANYLNDDNTKSDEARIHSPCYSYAFALFAVTTSNPYNPVNPLVL
jgi:hypothetical protein